MKIKYIFMFLLGIMMVISVSQIFSIPPYAGDIFKVYQSGYFIELEKQFEVIKDSFIGIKMLGKPVYGWIFLEDIKEKHGIDITVYNNRGYEVAAPGEIRDLNRNVLKLLNSIEPVKFSRVEADHYYTEIPVRIEKRCRFCHNTDYGKEILGVMTFKRRYDASVYYSGERVLIFSIISLSLLFLMFLVMRWDPEKKVKELFDKK
jgi:hypothetical protein